MDISLFHVFLFIHLVFLIMGFGAVIVIDTFGLLWTMKRTSLTLVNQVASVTQRLVWAGWGGLVVSGIGLIVLKGFVSHLAMIKIFFVVMLGVNGILLHLVKRDMYARAVEGETIPSNIRTRIIFSSAVSQIGWWGAMVIGFLNRNVRPSATWPPHPEYIIGGLSVIFILIGALTMPRHRSPMVRDPFSKSA